MKKRAYFILQSEHIRNNTESVLKELFGQYEIIVCNPAIRESLLIKLKAVVPDVKLLAYENLMDATEISSNELYFQKKARVILPRITDVCLYKDTLYYMLTPDLVRELVEFHVEETFFKSFSGLYLDICCHEIPEYRKELMRKAGWSEEFIRDRNLEYVSSRQYFTALMRNNIDSIIMIGNTSTWLNDPTINGVSIEGVGGEKNYLEALGIWVDQDSVSWPLPAKTYSIAWITKNSNRVLIERFAGAIPWLYAGDINSTE